MAQSRQLTAIIEPEGDDYVALCPALDIASQGGSIEQTRANLKEALELFFETADPAEIGMGVGSELFVTHVDIATNSDWL